MRERSGKCLCGEVTFKASGDVTQLSACHCGMCRRQNGGSPYIGLRVSEGVTLEKTDGLALYKGSDWGERGFCKNCGTTLFWRLQGEENAVSISVGTLNETDDLKIKAHIFTDEAPDYYTLTDDAPHKTGAQLLKEFNESQKNV